MKIRCPACGAENYFSGLEDEGTMFCSNCNAPLVDPENSDATLPRHKEILDKETFCNKLIVWIMTGLDTGRKGLFQNILKEIEGFEVDRLVEKQFIVEHIYFNMWLVYMNCAVTFKNENKVDDYFFHFVDKIYDLLFKTEFGVYGKENWEKNLTKKIKGYAHACTLSTKRGSSFNKLSLGREFYKNLYEKAELDSIKIDKINIYVIEGLMFSIRTLRKLLMEYEI